MGLTSRLDAQPHVDADLRTEILNHTAAPLLQSRTWFRLWAIRDRLVGVLEGVYWKRCGGLPCDGTPTAEGQAAPEPAGRKPADAAQLTIDKWFTDCEEFVALQYAFLLRDVLARIMSALFAAMLCLTLMTAAHLFYLFQGRSSLLMVDLLAVCVTAVAAIRIVVGMERDTVHQPPPRHDTRPGGLQLGFRQARGHLRRGAAARRHRIAVPRDRRFVLRLARADSKTRVVLIAAARNGARGFRPSVSVG